MTIWLVKCPMMMDINNNKNNNDDDDDEKLTMRPSELVLGWKCELELEGELAMEESWA